MVSKKPKILFVGPIPPPYSGPELSMQQFLKSKILNDVFDITFLKTNFRSDNTKKGKFGILMVFNFFIFFIKLLKVLIFNKPICIYYPITPTQIGWIGRDVWTILLSKFFGVKVIIHLRASHFKLNFKHFNRIAKKLIGFSLKKVDKAIVQAKYLEDQFLPYVSTEKVSVLYQAMDTNKFSLCSDEIIQKGKILIVGHLTKAKGYTDILKVIPDIAKEFSYVKFYFAGNIRSGERGVFYNQFTGDKIKYEDPFIAEQAILSSEYKFNYKNLGIITGEEKLNHFHTADIFLSASYSEGFSRSLLEAMSVGKPIIYTPVGAHREVFNEKHGNSFTPGDLDKLRSALKQMLNTDGRQIMGVNNRNYVALNFTLDKIVTDFKIIINETISKL